MNKKIPIFIALLFIGASIIPLMSTATITETYANENIQIAVQKSNDITTITYHIPSFDMENIQINGDIYTKIILGDESNFYITGYPDLPNIRRSVLIPDVQEMTATVIYSQYTDYENVKVSPSKGTILRTTNPEDVPYIFESIYSVDDWYPTSVVELDTPYIIRDFRGQVIQINPFQYNPVTETLRFYSDITIELYPIGEDTRNCIYRDALPTTIDSEFSQIYQNHFINYNTAFPNRYNPVEEKGNMIIITYDAFWNDMLPYLEWKNQKGIPTEMIKVSEIGDANAIKAYIAQYYNQEGLTFVLLVGDAAQVPPYYSGYAASDPSLTYVVGSDHYPDLFVGRFSAQNIDQLSTQIERSIEYEKYPQAGADWYHKGIGVASNQGPGDDGEYDDEHMDYIRDDLLAFTYTEVGQSYDYTGTTAYIAQWVNNGLSTANYCGHGSPTSWGNGGGFSNSDVNQLTNDNMLPFITSVACNNGEFDSYDTCYAEAWLRATNNGEPTGAIGMYASTVSQSWNPPMDAQDEFIDILVQTYTDNRKSTYGALCYNGAMHMNDEYGSSGYSETDYWTVFGDPSIQVRTDTPSSMTVNHDALIPIGATETLVEVVGVEDALCAISADGELLGNGYTDATGMATVTFFEPMEFNPGVDLYVTAFNKEPYHTQVQVGSSYPPEIPTLEGPEAGCRNKEYEFTAQTTDPEGDQIYYTFDWGDGSENEWFGPVNSGDPVTVTHAWAALGNYSVRVRAKDTEGSMSRWSDPMNMYIDIPVLDLATLNSKLVKIGTTVRNNGVAEADNVQWSISLDGGVILLGKESSGVIDTIPAGGRVEIASGLILGFGQTRVTAIVETPDSTDTRTQGANIFFFFVTIRPGGG